MGRVFRATLLGERAELGQVAARDFAQLLLGIERSLAKAAGHVIGRRVRERGRRERLIESATRLRLIAVEAGSVVGVLDLPDLRPADEQELGLTAADLSTLALERTLDAADGQVDGLRDVARALVKLTEDIGVGTRYDAVVIEEESPPLTPATPKRVVLNLEHRQKLRRLIEPGAHTRPGTLAGVLVEADFENHTARLKTTSKAGVEVRFEERLSDEIQSALRQQASLEGEVKYDPETLMAKSVRLREIARADQLLLGVDKRRYWEPISISQLADEQGVEAAPALSALRDFEATPEEIEAVLAALNE